MSQELRGFVEDNGDRLLRSSSVQSVGVGKDNDGNLVIIVGVEAKDTLSSQEESVIGEFFPQSIPYEIREVGVYEAQILLSQEGFTGRHRPVKMGASCGHPNITAGTVGFMYQSEDGTRYVGSNNHVLANTNQASVGDPSLQPGPADGGSLPEDDFGTLVYFAPIQNGAKVDLAISRADVPMENSILGIDERIKGIDDNVQPGDKLIKSGRTTGVTEGEVQQVGAAVRVRYGGGNAYRIQDCIITEDMSDGGDSGSAAWKEQEDGLYAAGRLFAGSSSSTVFHTFMNELNNLQENFEESLELITDGGEEPQPIARVTLTLEKTGNGKGTIQVRATAEEEGNLSDVEVSIDGPTSKSKITGAQGIVAFFDIPLGDYTITGTREGYEDATASVSSDDFKDPNL